MTYPNEYEVKAFQDAVSRRQRDGRTLGAAIVDAACQLRIWGRSREQVQHAIEVCFPTLKLAALCAAEVR